LAVIKAESERSAGLFAIIDFAQTVCTLLKKHMRWRRSRRKIQILYERGTGRGIKADLSKCIMAQVICVYIEAWKYIFYYSGYCINPTDNSSQMLAGVPRVYDGETHNGAHICPPLFSQRATFSSL